MATIDLGRLGFVNKGTYNNSTTYEKNDLVQFTDGGILSTYLYIDSTAQSGQAPSSSGTAGSRWVYFAKGGAAGADGTDVAAVLNNNEIAFKTNAGALDGLAIGSAGQALKVNSGANGYEFGSAGEKNTPAFDAQANASQTISNGTNTKVIFGLENVDTDNDFASSRFTASVAGWYVFHGSTGGTAKNGYIALWIKKNGSTDYYMVDSSNHNGSYLEQGTKVLYMNVNDYVEVWINMANGRTLSHNSTNAATRFSGYRIIT